MVQNVFNLTPAEAKVAVSIARGDTVTTIATDRRVSINTVKVQLHAALQKIGLNRQAELAGLLMGNPAYWAG
ncbi:MAG: LuxR C-terminal-related transcriptional regulator [Burkholderiaceae bacterium]